ncbi:MAG: hypothetical protein U0736_13465 [Gemmataceae bacterium]
MKPLIARSLVVAFAILVVAVGPTFAGPVYFSFESQVSVPNSPWGSFTPVSPSGHHVDLQAISGSHVAGPSSIDVAYLRIEGRASDDSPFYPAPDVTFDPQPFSLSLSVKDEASQTQGTLTFHGTFSGDMPLAHGDLSFSTPVQSLTLGNYRYTVDLSQQARWYAQEDHGMLGAGWWACYYIPAQVDVQPATMPTATAPEPTALVLVGMGVFGVLGGRLPRRRSQPA